MKKIIIMGIIIMGSINVFSQTYNPQKAAEYANFWCDKRNIKNGPYYDPEKWGGPYVDYDYYGGDCAAFVSQCLIYGGLDLSKGTNGNGNGVKPDKVISGASNLVLHLSGYQNTSIYVINGYNPPTDHDVGDPMFTASGSSGIEASHSMFCSSLDWNAKRLYSMHSTDYCNSDWPTNLQAGRFICFHIKSSIPAHCDDCKKNHGEKGVDCGYPCPPCDHAPDRVIIDSPTSDLPSDVRAVEEIKAGNAAVKVLAGQNVNFTSAGTIRLLPGFEAQAGSNFNAQIKGSILSITADCNKFCWPKFYGQFLRWAYPYTLDDVANVDRIYYEIYSYDKWTDYKFVYSDMVYVTQEGRVELWDLVTGKNLKGHFVYGKTFTYIIEGKFYPCQNPSSPISFWDFFYVHNTNDWKYFSSNTDSDFSVPTPPETFSSPSTNDIPSQDKHTTPSFIIIPNPNPGAFQIETNFPLSEIALIKITNLLGVPVYETQNPTSNTIQLPATVSGQHFVALMLKNGKVLTQKMMVQR